MRLALVLVVAAGCRYNEPLVGDGSVHPDGPRDTSLLSCSTYPIIGQTNRYRFTAAMGDYPTSVADCGSDGGHLVKIDDVVEDALINTAFMTRGVSSTSYVWIGLSDPTMTDNYTWYDGTALGAYNAFPGGHPPNDNDGMHNCGDKRGDGPWAIFYCDTVQLGFCECN